MNEEEFPTSVVLPRSSGTRRMSWSPMWMVTLLCLVIAIGLTWAALDAPGVWLKIRFDRGHGLKVGDGVIYRGIEVGHVGKLTLRENLDGIDVHVLLNREAESIAREGSRFWIVRPQVGVQGISGLDTAIGSKYLSVIPGRSETRQVSFVGLETPPPDGADRGGIELVLRGDDRWSVNPGSPLSWRGIEVGQVLGSSLSPDARHVDTRVRLDERYRSLLSTNSKFWVTSGIQMDIGVTGLKMSAESLSTIARGGVAFITPASPGTNEMVGPGEVFKLHRQVDENWIKSASGINRFEAAPPSVVRVRAVWKEKFFGLSRSRERSSWAITLERKNGVTTRTAELILPSDLVRERKTALDGSYQLSILIDQEEIPLSVDEGLNTENALMRIPISPNLVSDFLVAPQRFRSADVPEDVIAVSNRTTGRLDQADQERVMITEMIGREQLSVADDGNWRVLDASLSSELWHGAPVLSAADEQIIGMLIVTDSATLVAQWNGDATAQERPSP